MTPLLRKYLELERLMLLLEEGGDAGVDTIRDLMDPIWYSLSERERQLLDDRTIGRVCSLEDIRVPVGDDLFVRSTPQPERRDFPKEAITDWSTAA